MTSTSESLRRAILDSPDDDTVYLVYADSLQEDGRETEAESIRVQCELLRIVTGYRAGVAIPSEVARRYDELRRRLKDLLLQLQVTEAL